MTNEEFAVKLEAVDARSKSNSKRLDKMERRQDALDEIVTSVGVLAQRQQTVETDVKEIKADVKSLTNKPAQRWEQVVSLLIAAVVGAFCTWIISGGLT